MTISETGTGEQNARGRIVPGERVRPDVDIRQERDSEKTCSFPLSPSYPSHPLGVRVRQQLGWLP